MRVGGRNSDRSQQAIRRVKRVIRLVRARRSTPALEGAAKIGRPASWCHVHKPWPSHEERVGESEKRTEMAFANM